VSNTVFYITNQAYKTALRIKEGLGDCKISGFDRGLVHEAWQYREGLIFIMAMGIVIRTITPLIRDKREDPPVVVVDETGRYVISLLSGHLGGANALTQEIAGILGAEPVLTTSTDLNGLTPPDLWAMGKGLVIENSEALPSITTRFIQNRALRVFVEKGLDIELPEDYLLVEPAYADMLVTNRQRIETCGCKVKGQLYVRPKNLFVGIGCNSGTTGQEISEITDRVFKENNLSPLAIACIATIYIKTKEPGLRDFAQMRGLALKGFTAERLNKVEGIMVSEAAVRATGANAVAEPSAILAARLSSDRVTLIVPKIKSGNVTVAVAEASVLAPKKARLMVVGTGPGDPYYMTEQARSAIKEADIIVGYDAYIDQIRQLIKDKQVFSTGMTAERDRCLKAIEMALLGNRVAVVSGGDPGIYAMAGLVLELLKDTEDKGPTLGILPSDIEVEIIPGISSLNACASRLGAPLMHDFASISLSDRLTKWEVIEKRLDAAARADFVIVLYNPKSKGRPGHINVARDIILKHRPLETPVGIVRGAMRSNESVIITTLKDMLDHEIDMQSTVIVGNSQTFRWHHWLITPRGYSIKDE
jgi:cobalt-precorrin 5A hydrolase/precorrin-3B C17-methyltransferase